MLFVTVTVAVSSLVHLAARRAVQAATSREETASLLALARTVLGGADTPTAVLDHLTGTLGGRAELQEFTAGRWIRVAVSGGAGADTEGTRIHPRPGLALLTTGQTAAATTALLAGFGAQAAAALDRERLRMQASQAEALAEGNRHPHRPARRGQPRPAHPARLDQGQRQQPPADGRRVDRRRRGGPARDHRAERRPAGRADREPARPEPAAHRIAGAVPAPDRVDEVAPVALRGLDAPVQLEISVPDDVPLVRADPGLLERVLANIFSNALRHSPSTWPPALHARQTGETVLLEIVDHGPGVPGDLLKERIFEPFQRLDAPARPGVGLGLAVAKGFAEAMGGTIAAVDTPGGGLTIQVTMPVAHSDDRSVLGAGHVTRVLVIDDEPSILRALRINLSARQYEVSTAADGTSGLAAVARERPDVLILDLGLPDMDGTEVISGVRGWTSIPIIVLSVWGQESQKVAALDAGADDYVTKPFGMDELLARLRAAVRRAVPAPDEPVVTTDDFTVDLAAKRVVRADGAVYGSPPRSGSCSRSWCAIAGAWSPSVSCSRRYGGPRTRPRATTCASTWLSCAANWSPSRPSRATCSPSRAWATASRPDPPPAPRPAVTLALSVRNGWRTGRTDRRPQPGLVLRAG